jgi:hypothetical protein
MPSRQLKASASQNHLIAVYQAQEISLFWCGLPVAYPIKDHGQGNRTGQNICSFTACFIH